MASNWNHQQNGGHRHFSNPPRQNNYGDPMSRRSLENISVANSRGPQLPVRIMCYNVLSDHLLWVNQDMYADCPPQLLEFNARKHAIIRTIVTQNPTIICLQEVDDKFFESFYSTELRKYGYEGKFIKRTGRDKFDGVAIFYKTDEFHMLTCDRIEYFVSKSEVLDRDNVGLVLSLQPLNYKKRQLPRRLCVATTHILYNVKRGDVKLAQVAYLLAALDRAAQVPGEAAGTYYPSILCGDMNSVPFSPLFNFITTGHSDYRRLDKRQISGQRTFRAQNPEGISRNILPPHITHECKFTKDQSVNIINSDSQTACGILNTIQSQRNASNLHPEGAKKEHFTSTKSYSRSKSSSILISQSKSSSVPISQSCATNSPPKQLKHPRVEGNKCSRSSKMSVEVNSYSDLEVKPGDLLAFPSISSHSSNGENTADRTMSSTSLHSNSSGARLKQTSRTESPAESSAGSAECGEAWGVLSHQFNFLSAYEHHCIKRLLPRLVCPEVTTQHGGMDYGGEGAVGLTVDFVFYTGVSAGGVKRKYASECNNVHGSLTLLSRYGLLSSEEITQAGNLPNHSAPSDHLPLVAEFSLHK